MTNEQDREVVLQWEMPFPPELIWTAITDPQHMPHWWGPDGFTVENLSIDLRVGGVWAFDMIGPDGTRFPNHAVFTEVTPPSKLAFDQGDGQRIWFASTIVLQDTGHGTLITLRHLFPSKAERDEVVEKYGAIEGGKQHLAKLEAYVRANLV
ncbi:ATPase [Sinimarinibacterium sp. CAU 1509]|uniref:SRPBCC domain-containing protein n=1 Tax=Sinimarinibacterium sp. CAU 1509 TaxID=2562283 RepID=UPI0010AB8136|nr:SRPBCC domain-containing protein [Sinimarinibacterium sp. CAU 1509]TJY62965.1 ATPase [Sinimarinibacterium sp. CAU 1509]